VTTGIGAVINTAKVEIGSRAIVFGLGGIGLNVIQGCGWRARTRSSASTSTRRRRPMAERFGMTDFVNPKEVEGDLVPYLVDLTKGGADYTFDATGNVQVMRAALECAHKGWGESIIIGVAPAGAGDLDPAVPAGHRPVLARHGLRRRARAHRRAEDRRLVHGRQDRDRPDDHPHHAARRHQQGLRPDAGSDEAAWRRHDATQLIEDGARFPEFLVDQGTADGFLENGLRPWLLKEACRDTGIELTLRMQEGYDHSYNFISTFMDDHLAWHAKRLG
jgi:hypothetical protein